MKIWIFDHDKPRVAIQSLKNNKAADHADLFKAGGNKLTLTEYG